MTLFLSRFDNKVDRKGRVSIPAPWRTALANTSFAGVVIYPSPIHQAIEGADMARMTRISESIDQLNPFSDENNAFATSILGGSFPLTFDGDGRVVLPQSILEHAGITNMATFSGKGATFQIWNPEAYETYLRDSQELARQQAANLKLVPREEVGG